MHATILRKQNITGDELPGNTHNHDFHDGYNLLREDNTLAWPQWKRCIRHICLDIFLVQSDNGLFRMVDGQGNDLLGIEATSIQYVNGTGMTYSKDEYGFINVSGMNRDEIVFRVYMDRKENYFRLSGQIFPNWYTEIRWETTECDGKKFHKVYDGGRINFLDEADNLVSPIWFADKTLTQSERYKFLKYRNRTDILDVVKHKGRWRFLLSDGTLELPETTSK